MGARVELGDVAGSKGARVVDLWETTWPRGGWNFSFERHFNDWELEAVQSFLCTVNSRSIKPHIKDKLCWKEASLESTMLNLVLMCWKVGDSIWCLLRCCGILLFPQKWCFLLGKFGGAKI